MLAGLLGGAAAQAAESPSGTVLHLAEQAQALVAPDQLDVGLRAEVQGTDAARIQQQVNAAIAAAIAKAKASGLKVATGGYSVYQVHAGGPARPRDRTDPVWRASQGITLSGSDSVQLLDLAGRLQADGLLMSGMAFSIAPATRREAEARLTEEAVAGLRAQAERVAAAFGARVAGWRDIQVQHTLPMPVAMSGRLMMAKAAMAEDSPPSAEPAPQTVEVVINAEIILAFP